MPPYEIDAKFSDAILLSIKNLDERIDALEASNDKTHEFIFKLVTEVHDRVYKNNGQKSLTSLINDINRRLDEIEKKDTGGKDKCDTDENIIEEISDIVIKKKSIKGLLSAVAMAIVLLYEAIKAVLLIIKHRIEAGG